MVNKELLDFISGQLRAGSKKEDIKISLAQNNWSPTDIDEAFSLLATPPAPANINPQPAQQPSVQQQSPSGFSGVSQVNGSGSKKKIIVGIILVLIILAIGCTGAWAYFNYVAPDPQTTVNNAFTNLADQISSKGVIGMKSNISVGVRGVFPPIPGKSTLNFNLTTDAISDVTNNKASADVSFNWDLNDSSGMSVKVDGQNFMKIISVGDKKFVKINKMPSGLDAYLSKFITSTQLGFISDEIIGKWIEVDSAQTKMLMRAANIVSLTNVNGKLVEATTTPSFNMKGLANALRDSNVFVIDQTLPSETINGQGVFHYKVKLNKDGLVSFLLAVSKMTNGGQYPTSVSEQSMKKNVDQMFAQLEDSSQGAPKIGFDIYVGRFSKMLVKMTLDLDYGNSPKLKQSGVDSLLIKADTSYDFPSTVNITEPDSYTRFIDLMTKLNTVLMPSSSGDARNAQRRSDVTTILSAVYQYAIDNNGTMPASIPKLATNYVSAAETCQLIIKPQYEICGSNNPTCTGRVDLTKYFVNSPVKYLTSIPRDPQTGGNTSYYIAKLNNNRIMVCAPLTENNVPMIGVAR